MSGFRGTRINTHNDDVIPYSAFAPSDLTFHQSIEVEDAEQNLPLLGRQIRNS
jgi:hypothetical protein